MMTPTSVPIVMPLPSLGHRQICIAGLARGHPDRGEAAIMGVPFALPRVAFVGVHEQAHPDKGNTR